MVVVIMIIRTKTSKAAAAAAAATAAEVTIHYRTGSSSNVPRRPSTISTFLVAYTRMLEATKQGSVRMM
jgi:hypothetical protein